MSLFRLHRIPFRRVTALALITGLATVGAALAAAPYLPRLVQEGYPSLYWPAAGSFKTIAGDRAAAPFEASGKINAWSRELLSESNGAALLVFHDGHVGLAHYAAGVRPDTRFNSFSMTKSLIGALLLKAIADGRIGGLDDPIGRYLPDVGDEALRAQPLRAFATMRSGIAADAGDAKAVSGPELKDLEAFRLNPFGPMARLHMAGLDAIAGELRVDEALRGKFSYQNANTALLGAVLARAYGKPLDAVLAEKIWRPAGAGPADWRRYGDDLAVTAYCCIYATPSDWLRVGIYLMHNGTPDAPYLPEPLWRTLFAADVAPSDRADGYYGIHLYHNVLDRDGEPVQGPFSYMFGSRGQIVYMMPERDLVVVRFGDGIQLVHSTLYAAYRSLDSDVPAPLR